MRNSLRILLSVLLIVVFAALAGRALKALADGPPAEVVANLKIMRTNQEVLAETREAHEQFMKAKQENAELEQKNLALGWRTEWSTMEAVPLEPSFLPPL